MNKPARILAGLALAFSALAVPVAAQAAAQIVIVNGDPANVGFNDPTPAAPIGGNPGTTLGEQRLNVYQAVADKWGAELTSAVPILVYATWEALSCDAQSAVLGSAGAVFVNSDFPNAPHPGTWYSAALANKLAGEDLIPPDPGSNDIFEKLGVDIRARFNVNLGNPDCLAGLPFYLGLDNNAGSAIDFYTVLLHELGHGLGFQVLTNSSNGRRLGNPPLPSMWERLMLDNDTGKTWFEMSNFERRRSAVNFRSLVWTGASVTANASTVLSLGSPQLTKNGLRPKTYEVATGTFSAPLTPAGVTAKAATIVTQPGEVGPGCSPYDAGNAAAVAGKIAVVDRGACALTQKVKNAQDAGAVGVIIAQVVAGSPTTAGGSDPAIVIPAVVVSQDDGADIKATIRPGFQPTLTMRLNTSQLAGADTSGRVFLYTPDPLSGGSSVSHWDTLATRNLLMEPFINDDLSHEVKAPHDLTLQLFIDLGW